MPSNTEKNVKASVSFSCWRHSFGGCRCKGRMHRSHFWQERFRHNGCFFSRNFCFWWLSSWWAPLTVKIVQTHHNMLTYSHVDYITSVESKEVCIPEGERLNFSQWKKSAIRRFFMFIVRVRMIYNRWNRPSQPIKSLRLSAYSRKSLKKYPVSKELKALHYIFWQEW
jgi:hypothetical protein